MSNAKPAVIKATLYWANLTTENEESGKYQVDLGNLSEAAVEKLESMGLEVNYKEDRGDYITCKSTRPIRALDAETKEDIADVGIGNGTKATAAVSTYEWTYKKKKGVSASLKRLVITDLVQYDGGDDFDMDEDEAL